MISDIEKFVIRKQLQGKDWISYQEIVDHIVSLKQYASYRNRRRLVLEDIYDWTGQSHVLRAVRDDNRGYAKISPEHLYELARHYRIIKKRKPRRRAEKIKIRSRIQS